MPNGSERVCVIKVRVWRLIVGLVTAARVTCADAVMLSANGIGQVLIYPYYTVRSAPAGGSPYNALLSIVNLSAQGKVVKVRFREALAGAPVFEVNVFLSLKDVWTAAVVPVAGGAGMMSADRSCTRPSVAAGPNGLPTANGKFQSTAYATDPLGADGGRVQEGFVEVLELGAIRKGSSLDKAVTHIAGAAPCNIGDDAAIAKDLEPPSGNLFGAMTLINVLEGTAYGFDAAALASWSRAVLYSPAGTNVPTLADANPPVSSVVLGDQLVVSSWSTGVEAVNAALSTGLAQAEFMRDPVVDGATDVVYTSPTKPLLVSPTGALPPFYAPLTADGACEPSRDLSLSREEQQYNPNENQAPLPAYAALCWASTVQSFNAVWPSPTAVAGSRAGLRHFNAGIEVSRTPTIYAAGVAQQSLYGETTARDLRAPGDTLYVDMTTGTQSTVRGVVYSGLPMVGVSLVRYVNGALTANGQALLSNYGAGSAVKMLPSISHP